MSGSAVGYAVAAAICFALTSALQHQAATGEQGYRSGIGLLWVLSVVPGGIGQVVYGIRDHVLRWIANRRGIHVPSLVADKRVEGVAEHAEDEESLLAGALSGPVVDVTGNGSEDRVEVLQ